MKVYILKIANDIYQISGHPYGFNSNMYAVKTHRGIIIIDSGFSEYQYRESNLVLNNWGLNSEEIIALFITHAHFDHVGNAFLYKERGISVYAGENDADVIENCEESVLEFLFQQQFHVCQNVRRVTDREVFDFDNVTLEVWSSPGHTKGNVSYLVSSKDTRIMFVGDMLAISGTTPTDELLPELGWDGSPDYNRNENINSLDKLRNLKVDIVAPGHGSVYYGDSSKLFETLYKMAIK